MSLEGSTTIGQGVTLTLAAFGFVIGSWASLRGCDPVDVGVALVVLLSLVSILARLFR